MLPTSILVYPNNILWKCRMHPFHLVSHSPWPLTGALGSLFLFMDILIGMKGQTACIGAPILILTRYQWWRDVCREATFQGKHTKKVESGLRLGIVLFIIREACLFFSFFWAFFHISLRPSVEVGGWPPTNIISVNPMTVPLLNTIILLSRCATITWAHSSIVLSYVFDFRMSLSIFLGLLFLFFQWLEYRFISFTISDSAFGRAFYLTTGFHGLHVLIGTVSMIIMLLRSLIGHFSELHHFGFEACAWYWHFVDVIWIFLFICIYWWGS